MFIVQGHSINDHVRHAFTLPFHYRSGWDWQPTAQACHTNHRFIEFLVLKGFFDSFLKHAIVASKQLLFCCFWEVDGKVFCHILTPFLFLQTPKTNNSNELFTLYFISFWIICQAFLFIWIICVIIPLKGGNIWKQIFQNLLRKAVWNLLK